MDDFVIRTHENKEELIQIIRSLKLNPNRPITVKIKEPKRRLSQNALYWAWLTEIAKFWNYDNNSGVDAPEFTEAIFDDAGKAIDTRLAPIDKDSAHCYFADYFLPRQKIKMIINGKAVYKDKIPSTSGLDVRQFNEYLTKIKILMQNVWGFICETPDDSAFYEYYMKLDKDSQYVQ